MNKKYGIIGLVLAVLLSTVLISGCVGGEETQTNPTPTNQEASGGLKNEALVDEILKNYDQDNDDNIDAIEFGVWGGSVGLDLSDVDELAALFKKYDLNGDELLDKNELDSLAEDYK